MGADPKPYNPHTAFTELPAPPDPTYNLYRCLDAFEEGTRGDLARKELEALERDSALLHFILEYPGDAATELEDHHQDEPHVVREALEKLRQN